MAKKYRVRFFQGYYHEVINVQTNEGVFQGDLSDCEAYIRLKEGEYS